MDKLFGDLTTTQKISFVIQLAGLKLIERKWLATGDEIYRQKALSIVSEMEQTYC